VLFDARRYDGAVYLCGYAVEVALKAAICKRLRWSGYPSTKKEFQPLQSFRTHSLDNLLKLTSVEVKIKSRYLAEWSAVVAWEPHARYKPIGAAHRKDTKTMIDSARVLLNAL